jgi:hypothetical protein
MHGITLLAPSCTSQIKYGPDTFAEDAAALEALPRERRLLL